MEVSMGSTVKTLIIEFDYISAILEIAPSIKNKIKEWPEMILASTLFEIMSRFVDQLHLIRYYTRIETTLATTHAWASFTSNNAFSCRPWIRKQKHHSTQRRFTTSELRHQYELYVVKLQIW